jgi:hypothetical protein
LFVKQDYEYSERKTEKGGERKCGIRKIERRI